MPDGGISSRIVCFVGLANSRNVSCLSKWVYSLLKVSQAESVIGVWGQALGKN